MQAIWKGSISFGMVSIPIKVFSATSEKDISFRQVHAADRGRIRYKRVCEVCGNEIPYSDISKGYEMPDGQIVVLDDEDFAQLPLPTAKSVDVLEFVPAEQVDPLFYSKAYYLAADGPGAKPYVLLRDALTSTGQCALVKVAIRSRESLALLRERDGVLVLQTMLWPEEIRDSGFAVPSDVEVKSQEVKMAESYISTLEADFEPERYHDDYRRALEELITAKTEGLELEPQPEQTETGGEVVDLVAALRASVEAAKARRGETAGASSDRSSAAATKSGGRRSASKSTSKKTDGRSTAKKTASRSPAKKSASKSASKKSTAKKSARKSA